MKRFMAVLMVFLLVVSCAFASDLDTLVEGHNKNAAVTGAGTLSGKPEKERGEKYDYYQYKVTDEVYVLFYEKEGKIMAFACICMEEGSAGEFLAQCATAFYNIGGTEAGTACHGSLLQSFLSARAGHDVEAEDSVPGFLYTLRHSSGGYTFTMMWTK